MQNVTPCLTSEDTASGSDPVFNVVIAYEDYETGKMVKRTYDYLVEHLGRECEMCHQMWKFEVLALPKLREYAVQDSLAGDIIIISCHGRELPLHVREWLEAWGMHPARALALVLLSDSTPEESRALYNYLGSLAHQTGVEFFAQPGAWPGHNEPVEVIPHNRIKDPAFSTLSDVLTRDLGVTPWSR